MINIYVQIYLLYVCCGMQNKLSGDKHSLLYRDKIVRYLNVNLISLGVVCINDTYPKLLHVEFYENLYMS